MDQCYWYIFCGKIRQFYSFPQVVPFNTIICIPRQQTLCTVLALSIIHSDCTFFLNFSNLDGLICRLKLCNKNISQEQKPENETFEEKYTKQPGHKSKNMNMLWFNFILSSNVIFLCFKLIIIHYNTQKQEKRKFEPWIKLNHNIYFQSFVGIYSFFVCLCFHVLENEAYQPKISHSSC